MAVAFFRYKPRAHQATAIDADATDGLAAQMDGIVVIDRIFARKRIEQLALPVAGHAGNRQHFPGAHLHGNRFQRHGKGRAWRNGKPHDLDLRLAERLARRPRNACDIAADHHARQRCRRFLARIAGAGHLAVTQDGGAVADALHLFQTVADIAPSGLRPSASPAFRTACQPPAASAPRSARRE